MSVARDESVASPRGATREIRRLSSLIEISQALSGTLNLSAALPEALDVLERHHQVVRSAVTLLDEETGELTIKASTGLSADGQRARYRLGEGITGRVVDTGKPIVVPQVSREPLLLNRAARRDRQELSFICVPILVNRRAVGALGVDLPFKRDRDFDRSLKFYKLVAAIVAQAVKVSRMAEAERKRLVDENTHLRDELRDRYAFQHLIGTSAPIRQVYDQVAQVARSSTTILIRGESGTGKEMIAHAIHYNSARGKKPFIKVSCAALPESLIESELFGYERGAFTGAQSLKKGRFELADGGTIFLDEIGDLSLATQIKLLRVLQEREFERLGGTQSIKVNVRLVAATHRPLERLIVDGLFREDLFYRLNVFTIFAPPLRERKPDIMLLADHFLQKYRASTARRSSALRRRPSTCSRATTGPATSASSKIPSSAPSSSVTAASSMPTICRRRCRRRKPPTPCRASPWPSRSRPSKRTSSPTRSKPRAATAPARRSSSPPPSASSTTRSASTASAPTVSATERTEI